MGPSGKHPWNPDKIWVPNKHSENIIMSERVALSQKEPLNEINSDGLSWKHPPLK